MFKIHIPQKQIILECEQKTPLMQFLLKNQIPVASSCFGDGICAKCKLKITPYAPPNELEQKVLARNNIEQPFRLSCQIQVEADLTLEAPYW